MTGVEQQDRRGEHLVVGEPVVAVLGPEQVAEQVVAQVASALARSARAGSRRTPTLATRAASCDLGGDDGSYIRTMACDHVAQLGEVGRRRAEQLGDDEHRQRLGEVGEDVEAPLGSVASSRRGPIAATRGRIRSMWPRAKAAETLRRSRECVRRLVLHHLVAVQQVERLEARRPAAGRARSGRAGGRAAPGCRPRARPPARSARPHASRPGRRRARRARPGTGRRRTPGSSRSSADRAAGRSSPSGRPAPNASGSTSVIGTDAARRVERAVRAAVLPQQLPAATAGHQRRCRLVDARDRNQPPAARACSCRHHAALGAERRRRTTRSRRCSRRQPGRRRPARRRPRGSASTAHRRGASPRSRPAAAPSQSISAADIGSLIRLAPR